MNFVESKARRIAISVVSPCYNEIDTVYELVRRVRESCKSTVGQAYEIVLVNDGSRDGTWARMAALAQCHPDIVAVNLSRNYGHQLALSAGLQICLGERILILDADLQDPPELLPKMMELMDAGADVVYGQRTRRCGETMFKKATAAGFYRILDYLVEIKVPKDTGDFRLISRRALNVLNNMPEHHRFIRGMISWIGFRQEALPYERQARFAGQTHYPLAKMLRFATDAITSFSIAPLRLASGLAIGAATLTIALMLFVFYRWAIGIVVPGWTSLILVVLVLSCAQFTVMAVFGEYLGRLYMESKRRPLFVVEDIVRQSELPQSAGKPIENASR